MGGRAVRERIAELADEAITPAAWAIDDTGLLKCGTASPCVARQYTGTAGKVTNCQIAVSVSMVTDTASCPVDWRLFLPESWDPTSPKAAVDVGDRRRKAGIDDRLTHREKWRLVLNPYTTFSTIPGTYWSAGLPVQPIFTA